jgi:hypothetical protein
MTDVAPSGPLCFLHVPKSAGSSFHEMLRAGYPEGALTERRCDTCSFAGFDEFDALSDTMRSTIAVTEEELVALGGHQVVSGHFALSNLLRLTTPDRIATVFREPRARLLSLYAYYRLSPWLLEAWTPYDIMLHGRRPLDEFLTEPRIAVETDNQACRLLLHGDPRIPRDDFIAAEDVPGLARAAAARLDEFGLVDVLELGRPTWEAFAEFFGVPATPTRVNVTGELPTGIAERGPVAKITPDTIRLLQQRNAVDSLLYDRALTRKGWSRADVEAVRDAAFAQQILQLGDIGGAQAVAAAQRAATVERQEQELDRLRRELAVAETELGHHRRWLAEVQDSASWRLTAPLRTAKQAARGSRRGH